MAQVTIDKRGCRGCTMCVDICPVEVFSVNKAEFVANVERQQDCIGCLSCVYVCPSRCVDVRDVEVLRPFHRIEKNAALVERFLQEPSLGRQLTEDDWREAHRDVAVRLSSLGAAVTETIGRGQKAVGRKAGKTAADHMPEMYEETNITDVLARMRDRFQHAFDFDFQVVDHEDAKEIALDFHPCGLYRVVTEQGGKVGESVLCQLFHEYWAGLIGAFAKGQFRCTMGEVGESCSMKLTQT